MSPKYGALAYDEINEVHTSDPTVDFEPHIHLIVDKLSMKNSFSSQIVSIIGKVTVSF